MASRCCDAPLSSESDLHTFITTGQASCWKMETKWTTEAPGRTRNWSPVVAGNGSSWPHSASCTSRRSLLRRDRLQEGGVAQWPRGPRAAPCSGLAGWCWARCPSRTQDPGDCGSNAVSVPDVEQTSSPLILKNIKANSNPGGNIRTFQTREGVVDSQQPLVVSGWKAWLQSMASRSSLRSFRNAPSTGRGDLLPQPGLRWETPPSGL